MGDAQSVAFEDELVRLGELDDPLCVFDRYYAHLLASSADVLTVTRILERATQTFVEDRRYRNDPRYLRLWLAYALRCREPEDIYAFLAMRSIAADLASYYEEYAQYLERKGETSKAGAVLKAGVERSAQPIERLNKKWTEFCTRHPSHGSRKTEVGAYQLPTAQLSFEEMRARSWRRAGSILKTSYNPPASVPLLLDDPLEEFEDGLAPADPDDLTHISIYKDNTADLRELARSLKENQSINNNNNNQAPIDGGGGGFSFDQFLKPAVGGFEPRNARLSLIPEESDANTQVSGLIPALLNKPKPTPLTTEDIRGMQREASVPVIESDELVRSRLQMLEKSIGRDGIGNNHTVASLRVASGHYFIERRLGRSVLLGIDLEADLAGSDLHQVAIKISDLPWEAHILRLLDGTNGVPALAKLCRHPDATVLTQSYFPHGSLASLVHNGPVDEKLVLFWIRELLCTVKCINRRGVVHGRLSLDHVLVRLGPVPLTASFDPKGSGGWSDRGIGLVGFSAALHVGSQEYMLDEAAAAVFGSGPTAARSLDAAGILSVISALLAGRTPLRYPAVWSEVTHLLECSLAVPHTIEAVYERAGEILDRLLVSESVVLPTLKSLLTRLEITLLERTPQ